MEIDFYKNQKMLNEENLDKYLNIVKKILIELGYPCSSIDDIRKYYVIPDMFLEHIDQSLNMVFLESFQLQLELVYNEENINDENESNNDENESNNNENESSNNENESSDNVDEDKSLYDIVKECLGDVESESSSDDIDKPLYDIVKECLGDVGFSSDSD